MNTNEKPKTGMQQGRQMRFTEAELGLMKATFKDNEPLLKLLRKIFLPELDPQAPLGEMIDLWMSLPTKDQTPEQIAIALTARNSLIQHIDMQLMQLKSLAGAESLTPEEVQARAKMDSAK